MSRSCFVNYGRLWTNYGLRFCNNGEEEVPGRALSALRQMLTTSDDTQSASAASSVPSPNLIALRNI